MEDVTFIDLLSPWVIVFIILFMVGYAEDWIHRHLFGIGYLITEDKMSATRLFYAFFLPGIFIHEFIQYLVAGAINVPIKKVVAWPDPQENGVMRLDFIVIDRAQADPIRSSIVAASPFAVMGVIVWYISTQILDLHILTESLGSGDLQVIWGTFTDLIQTPDFILWIYLLFVIANSMVPNRADARGLPLILGAIVVLLVVLSIMGMGNVIMDTLTTDVPETLALVRTALLTILVMDIGAILLLGFIEDSLERWRGFKMDYSQGENLTVDIETKKPRREPGSDVPLEAGDLLPSIYNRMLPLPDPKEKPKAPRTTPSPARPRETTEAEPVPAERPAFASRTNPSVARPPAEESSLARPSVTVRESTFGSQRPAPSEDKPAEETPLERPSFTRPTSTFGSQPPTPTEVKPAEEAPLERPSFTRPTSTFGSQRPTPSEDKPAEGKPAERPSFARRDAPFGSPPSAPIEDKPAEEAAVNEAPARPTGAFNRPTAPPPLSRPSPFRRLEPDKVDEDGEAEDDVEYVDMDDVEDHDLDDEIAQDVLDEE